MDFNIDEVVKREQEMGWHKGRPINPNLPEAKLTKIPTGPVGSQPGWTKSLGFDEFEVSQRLLLIHCIKKNSSISSLPLTLIMLTNFASTGTIYKRVT